jgi:putative resolvase
VLGFIIFIGRINYKYYMEDLFMSKYYSINKFSKILGVSAQTLRNWDKKGKLHPHHTSSNGYRYYSHEQLNQVMNVKPNLDRKELMKRISQNKVDKVVVFYKDRLLRFGFELVEYIASLYDCDIEIINRTEKTEQQELVEDLVQIITVFSCKLQGKRANKARKLVKELIDDGGEEDDKNNSSHADPK